ncbi:MAG TPA: glutaredoxin family protein [Candidatus Limnocylindrales bacterium]|nr:glutaredoxin family protein [Candidatus Limnocylindrales bacterium]
MAPLPDLILYARPECSLCDEAREAIDLVIADRRERGLAVPAVVERNIEVDPELHRMLLERIPVVEMGEQRVELVVSIGKLRRLLNEVLGATPDPAATPEPAAEVTTEA